MKKIIIIMAITVMLLGTLTAKDRHYFNLGIGSNMSGSGFNLSYLYNFDIPILFGVNYGYFGGDGSFSFSFNENKLVRRDRWDILIGHNATDDFIIYEGLGVSREEYHKTYNSNVLLCQNNYSTLSFTWGFIYSPPMSHTNMGLFFNSSNGISVILGINF